MSAITIHKPFFKELAETCEAIRNRAFELFKDRGGAPGFDLDDWFKAERELFWIPKAELKETEAEYTMDIDVTGFEDKEIHVSTMPGEIVVKAYSESESLYRRFEMGAFDTDKVTASLNKGTLRITAPKVAVKPVAAKTIPITSMAAAA